MSSLHLPKLPIKIADALLFGPEDVAKQADATVKMKIARTANYIFGLAVLVTVFITACAAIFLALA